MPSPNTQRKPVDVLVDELYGARDILDETHQLEIVDRAIEALKGIPRDVMDLLPARQAIIATMVGYGYMLGHNGLQIFIPHTAQNGGPGEWLDFDKWFFGPEAGRMLRSMNPAIDVYEKDGMVVVEAPITGFDPEKINIQFEDGVLVLSGQTEHKKEVDDKNYYRQEVRYGNFYRTVAMPVPVDGDKAEAEYKDGVLKVIVPQLGKQEKRSIKINVKK